MTDLMPEFFEQKGRFVTAIQKLQHQIAEESLEGRKLERLITQLQHVLGKYRQHEKLCRQMGL